MPELAVADFKRRIRIFVAFLLAAVIAVTVWSLATEYRNLIAAAERQTTGYAQALSEHTESAFAESDRIVKDVIQRVRMRGGIERFSKRELFDLLRVQGGDSPQVGDLFMAGRDGDMFINSLEFPPRKINVADRDYFRHYLSTPGADLYISRPVRSRLVNRWRFNLIRPLNGPHAEFGGLMVVAFEVEYFKRFFSASSLGPRGRVILVRTDGAPLVYEPYVRGAYQADLRNSQLFRKWLPASSSGTYHTDNDLLDHAPLIVSYKRLSRFPVVAVVSLHRDDILKPWTRKATLHGAVTLGLCLVIILLSRLMFRHLDRLESAQAGLREQQELLRIKAAQIDAANDAILQVDFEGNLIHFNRALCRMTGYGPDELSGKRLNGIKPPESAARTGSNIERIREQGEATFETLFLARNGRVIPVEVHARTMENDGIPFILSIARDVSERKRSELRERTRLSILEEMATGGDLEDVLAHIVTFVEQQRPEALCSVLLADESGSRLRHGAAPSLPDAYNRAVDGLRIAEGMGSCGTAAHRRQRVIIEDILGHPFWKGFKPALEAGLRACWSQPILSADDELLGTFAIYYRVPRSPDEEEIGLLESAAHLASIAIGRVRGEQRRRHLEDQLRHMQRIEAIGQMAGGIAHDFNNLLTPILAFADLICRDLPHDAPQRRMAESILRAAHKAKDLTQKLLSFGRRQMLNTQPLDLNEVIHSFHEILRRTIRENIEIRMGLAPGGAAILADRGQIEQILLNLAVNAQDAIEGNGSISIETGHVLLDDEYARRHPGMRSGPHVLLAFADNGCGMDDETLSHIFEPFFTTKQVGRGTGLGLATVYGVVKQHEGYIAVDSHVGRGTTFTIYLPAKANPIPSSNPEPAQRDLQAEQTGSRGMVLVVEDNKMVRDLVVELLETSGYGVLAAETPAEAYEMAQVHPDIIDLLVTDVVMPGMNGQELYERLLEMKSRLPVLFISGYTSDVNVHSGSLEEGVNFLQKPFTCEQFIERVRQTLAEAWL